MNKAKKLLVAFGLFTVAFTFNAPVQAASQDECAIWLCLPGGFPSGCGGAKSALKKRIKRFKPPLPSFASCAVNPPSGSGSHMSSQHGFAAFVPSHTVCTKWRGRRDDRYCVETKVVPDQYIKGTRCHIDRKDGWRRPKGCTHTERWAEVYIENQLAGPTFYWN
ncbi:conjugal transfer protein TraL [Vibrio diabolicus]|uniref:conjugal transfer protein TraL n=1 Tax=Vibrio diabolicus TaxID=50719 RepID=UPI00193B5771|nr:conjugal transfer protein TraL [Vibrio diabolicus]EGQ8484992.1 conjugal transfer protein TraL [Vibrio parahaemolyticus]EGQ9696284.1 conjugal transfer protein TraL [Vibrio parahaemolyticus]EJX1342484.1 conjugal transfer protein TraL [Vibrio parahaemolyticus]HCH1696706.1 conjugal transfer protein TraL [Vibrio parahaemolyticus]